MEWEEEGAVGAHRLLVATVPFGRLRAQLEPISADTSASADTGGPELRDTTLRWCRDDPKRFS